MKILYTYLEIYKHNLTHMWIDAGFQLIMFFGLLCLITLILLNIQDEIEYKDNLRIYDEKHKGGE